MKGKTKSVLLIGLGSFGLPLARDLVERGNEVAVVDSDEERADEVREFVDKVLIADASRREVIAELGVREFDTVVVNMGERIDVSVLATLHLKQLQAGKIIVKCISEEHETLLKMVGADQVIFPERDMALRLAYLLSNPGVVDEFVLASHYRIIEVAAPAAFLGQSLRELDLRNRYGVQVLLVEQRAPAGIVLPAADFAIKEGDVLVLMGGDEDLERLQKT